MGTRMELSRPLSNENGGFSLTFSELTGIVNVPSQGTVYLPLEAGAHRYEVKTVFAEADKPVKVQVELKDRQTNGVAYYGSLSENKVDDIAGVPAVDKTGNKRVHAFITNNGGEAANVSLVVKIIPMSGGN